MDIREHQASDTRLAQMAGEKRSTMRIAICGRFKSGKTSLLNLLLGINLPVKAVTATGIVTKIQYGVQDQVQMSDGSLRRVTKNELDKYIAVKAKTIDGIVLNEAVTAYVGCESGLLQKGSVEFWDTPGLEDDYQLTRITLEAIEQCDAAVLVLDATRFLSQAEKALLNGRLQECVGNNILVVVNRLDVLPDNDRRQIKLYAEEELGRFGNHCCGMGPVFTCADPKAPDITVFRDRITYLCAQEKRRQQCIDSARRARLRAKAEKWLSALEGDYEQLVREKKQLKHELDSFRAKRERELESAYREDKAQLLQRIQTASYDIDSTKRWTQVLSAVQSEDGWESRYVSLSTAAMKRGVEELFKQIKRSAEQVLKRSEYPKCFPLPELKTDQVWVEMDWGSNFSADRTGGMLAGAAAGAAAGSVIPGLGTLAGAFLGFFAGAIRDGAMDDSDKIAFQSQCIQKTVQAFQNGPASAAKQEVQRFQNTLLSRMGVAVADKKKRIALPAGKRSSYDLLCGQEQQLERYRSIAQSYTI